MVGSWRRCCRSGPCLPSDHEAQLRRDEDRICWANVGAGSDPVCPQSGVRPWKAEGRLSAQLRSFVRRLRTGKDGRVQATRLGLINVQLREWKRSRERSRLGPVRLALSPRRDPLVYPRGDRSVRSVAGGRPDYLPEPNRHSCLNRGEPGRSIARVRSCIFSCTVGTTHVPAGSGQPREIADRPLASGAIDATVSTSRSRLGR